MDSLEIHLDYELLVEEGFDATYGQGTDKQTTNMTFWLTDDSNIADKRKLQLKKDDQLLKGKYPAKEHARKVAAELGVRHGLIYLPGQVGKSWEDSDQEQTFRQRR